MNLYKEDIICIGDYAILNEDGNLELLAYNRGANSDEILLREILLTFGDYRIIDVKHYGDAKCFRTNLPIDLYTEARDNYDLKNNRKKTTKKKYNQ